MVELILLSSSRPKALQEGANVTDYRHYIVNTIYITHADDYSSLLPLIRPAHQPPVLSQHSLLTEVTA